MEQNASQPRGQEQDPLMPEKVLNKVQDPESIKDPLEEQQQKAAQMNQVPGTIGDSDPAFGPKNRPE